jgi:hypothetical protein
MARRERSDRDRHGSLADQIGLRLVKRRAELTACERLGDALKPRSPAICGSAVRLSGPCTRSDHQFACRGGQR